MARRFRAERYRYSSSDVVFLHAARSSKSSHCPRRDLERTRSPRWKKLLNHELRDSASDRTQRDGTHHRTHSSSRTRVHHQRHPHPRRETDAWIPVVPLPITPLSDDESAWHRLRTTAEWLHNTNHGCPLGVRLGFLQWDLKCGLILTK